jgi:hypothetical protein
MNNSSERLYEAFTDIRDEFIDEAVAHKFAKPLKTPPQFLGISVQWYAFAASLVLIFAIGIFALINDGLVSMENAAPGDSASNIGGSNNSGNGSDGNDNTAEQSLEEYGFGSTLSQNLLVEVTVEAVESILITGEPLMLHLRVDRVFSMPQGWEEPINVGDKTFASWYCEGRNMNAFFAQGVRFLVSLSHVPGFIESGHMARINEDDTITAIEPYGSEDGESIFADVDGYTLERFADLIRRINEGGDEV